MQIQNRVVVAFTLAVPCVLVFAPAACADRSQAAGTKGGFAKTADGVRIHYIEAGQVKTPEFRAARSSSKGPIKNLRQKPSILFVPGWTMPGWIWERQSENFSKTCRVVAIDPRSQGESSQTPEGLYPAARARDIKAVVDQLGLASVVLVGWSMAVNEVVAYVDQFGTDAVAGLVLVDDSAESLKPSFAKPVLDFAAGFLKDRRRTTARFVRSWFKKPQSEEYLNRLTEASLVTPTNSAVALLVGKFAADYDAALGKFDRPTLIVCAQSPYLPLVEDMQKRIGGSRIEIFKDAGHALFVDDPDRFDSVLDEFLKELAPTD